MKTKVIRFLLVVTLVLGNVGQVTGFAETLRSSENVVRATMESNTEQSNMTTSSLTDDSETVSSSQNISDSSSSSSEESSATSTINSSNNETMPSESATTSTSHQNDDSSTKENETDSKKVLSTPVIPNLNLKVHIQSIGDEVVPPSSSVTGGTTGLAKRLEGMELSVDPNSTKLEGSIVYSTHVQTYGWSLGEKKDGEFSGTKNEGKRLEAVKINLTGELSEMYDIYYRVHSQTFGWLDWAKNGAEAGSSGFAKRVESIQIQLVLKGEKAPGATNNPYISNESLTIPTMKLDTHVQTFGWSTSKSNGIVSGGVTNQSKRLEAMKISLENSGYDGNIEYRTYVQSYGWQSYKANGELSGTTNEAKRIEAVQVRLTGTLSQLFDVYYRVHIQSFGWLGWAKNDQMAGSVSLSRRVEAIEVQLVPKGAVAPGNTSLPFISYDTIEKPNINLSAHIQTYGWSTTINSGEAAIGTVGQGKRLEALTLGLENSSVSGGIEYRTHVQTYGWQDYQADGGMAGTVGEAKRIEAIQIRLTGNISLLYDVYYRVHSQTYGWLDWAKNDQRSGTSSMAKRVESIEIKLVPKGQAAPGNTSKPYIEKAEYLFVMGHGGIDPGAIGSGTNEREFTRNELLPYLKKYAEKLKESRIVFYDVNRDMFTDTKALSGAHTVSNSIASVTEFHLDAGGTKSTGGHVIVRPNGSNAVNLALGKTIRSFVGLNASFASSGGLSYRDDLLNLNVFRSRNIEYRLLELGFITNSSDVMRIRNNLDSIAKSIVSNVTGENL